MNTMDKPKLIRSDLSQTIWDDNTQVQVEIYRLEQDKDWTLEVVDKEDGSTVWDETFPTENEALEAVREVIKNEGIGTFVQGKTQTLH